MERFLKYFLPEESGQGLVEYALIISFVAIALVSALILLKGGLINSFTNSANEIENAS